MRREATVEDITEVHRRATRTKAPPGTLDELERLLAHALLKEFLKSKEYTQEYANPEDLLRAEIPEVWVTDGMHRYKYTHGVHLFVRPEYAKRPLEPAGEQWATSDPDLYNDLTAAYNHMMDEADPTAQWEVVLAKVLEDTSLGLVQDLRRAEWAKK